MWYVRERLKDHSRVAVDPSVKDKKFLAVQGCSILLMHDTATKSMESAAKQAMLLYGERIDFIICGHKHREQEVVSGYTESGSTMVLRIPSICGADRYAQSLGFGGAPGALLFVLEKDYGRRCVYPVSLQ